MPFSQRRASALFTHRVSELPFSSTIPKCSFVPARGQLADDHAVGDLDGGDVEGRRQVDDDAVDLAVLQRLYRRVVRVVDEGLRRGLDVLRDVRVARRSDLRAELERLEAGDRLDLRDRLALAADDRLVDEVVAPREIGRLCALGRVRDLRDVDVERLLAGAERVVEGDDRPLHLSLREAELLGDRVRDRRLVALPAVRIGDLPGLRLLRAAEPRWEGRVVGADRECAVLDEVQGADGAARDRRRGRPRRGRRRGEGEHRGRCEAEARDEQFPHGSFSSEGLDSRRGAAGPTRDFSSGSVPGRGSFLGLPRT